MNAESAIFAIRHLQAMKIVQLVVSMEFFLKVNRGLQMTPEHQETENALYVLDLAQTRIDYDIMSGDIDPQDRKAATVALLWRALELAAGEMSREALVRMIHGETD